MRSIRTTTRRRDHARWRPARHHGNALSRSHRQESELERSFEDLVREINHLIGQMSEEERRSYLAESLFLNTVKYENDKLEAYIRKLEKQ